MSLLLLITDKSIRKSTALNDLALTLLVDFYLPANGGGDRSEMLPAGLPLAGSYLYYFCCVFPVPVLT